MHAMGFSIFALTFNVRDRFYAPRGEAIVCADLYA
jgi:hypothetical protein